MPIYKDSQNQTNKYNVRASEYQQYPFEECPKESIDRLSQRSSIAMSSYHTDDTADNDSCLKTYYCTGPPSKKYYLRRGGSFLHKQQNRSRNPKQPISGHRDKGSIQNNIHGTIKTKTSMNPSLSNGNRHGLGNTRRCGSIYYFRDEISPKKINQISPSLSDSDTLCHPTNSVHNNDSPFSLKDDQDSLHNIRMNPFAARYGRKRNNNRIVINLSSVSSSDGDSDKTEFSLDSDCNLCDGNHHCDKPGSGEPRVDRLILVENQEIPDPSNQGANPTEPLEKRRKLTGKREAVERRTIKAMRRLDSGDASIGNISVGNSVPPLKPNVNVESPEKYASTLWGNIKLSLSNSFRERNNNINDSSLLQSDDVEILANKKSLHEPEAQMKLTRQKRSNLTTSRNHEKVHVSKHLYQQPCPGAKELHKPNNDSSYWYPFFIFIVSFPLAWLTIKLIATVNNSDLIIEPLFWFGDTATRTSRRIQCRAGQSQVYLPRRPSQKFVPEHISDRKLRLEAASKNIMQKESIQTYQNIKTNQNQNRHGHSEQVREFVDNAFSTSAAVVKESQNTEPNLGKQSTHVNGSTDNRGTSKRGPKSSEDMMSDLKSLGLGDLVDRVEADTASPLPKKVGDDSDFVKSEIPPELYMVQDDGNTESRNDHHDENTSYQREPEREDDIKRMKKEQLNSHNNMKHEAASDNTITKVPPSPVKSEKSASRPQMKEHTLEEPLSEKHRDKTKTRLNSLQMNKYGDAAVVHTVDNHEFVHHETTESLPEDRYLRSDISEKLPTQEVDRLLTVQWPSDLIKRFRKYTHYGSDRLGSTVQPVPGEEATVNQRGQDEKRAQPRKCRWPSFVFKDCLMAMFG